MKIVFVPIDDRPCSLLFPLKISRAAGIELLVPDRSYLGKFLSFGSPEGILKFLIANSDGHDAVVSLDMLIHGGLVASRVMDRKDDTAERLAVFEDWLACRKKEKTMVFSTITRTLPTLLNETDVIKSGSFIKSLRKLYPNRPLSDCDFEETLSKETKKNPFLSEYVKARNRNFSINLKACEWAEKGLVDFLIIGLDDVLCSGPNTHEASIISEKIKGSDRVVLCKGADELGMIAIARLLMSKFGVGVSVAPRYSSYKGSFSHSIYENSPVRNVVEETLRATGCVMRENSSDIEFFCSVAEKGQKEVEVQNIVKSDLKKAFVNDIARAAEGGATVAVADLSYSNGADRAFTYELLQRIDPVGLAGYAAWNTSANTIGTALAHAVISLLSARRRKHDIKTHSEFIFERFMDDYIYQSFIRAKYKLKCMTKGFSALKFDESANLEIPPLIFGEMRLEADKIFNRYFRKRHVVFFGGYERTFDLISMNSFNVCLPWRRLFEISLNAEFEVQTY